MGCFCSPGKPARSAVVSGERPMRKHQQNSFRKAATVLPSKTRQAPIAVLKLPFDLDSVTVSAQSIYNAVASTSPVSPTSAPTSASPRDYAPPPIDPADNYQLYKYSVFSERPLNSRCLKKRRKKEAKFLRTAASVREAATVVRGTDFDVESATTPTSKRAGMQGSRILPQRLSVSSQRRAAKLAPTRTSSVTDMDVDVQTTSHLHPPPNNSSSIYPDSFPSHIAETLRRQQVEAALIAGSPNLVGFTFSHRTNIPGQATSFVDASRRSFATRIECPDSMSTLAADLGKDVDSAVRGKGAIHAMPTDRSRGAHEVRQIGVHREQGSGLGYSGAFKKAVSRWTTMMDGVGFKRARGHVSRCLQTHYPELFDYHRTLATSLATVSLYFLFGAFASFCLNTGGKVSCLPHRDTHNLGPGLCGILPWDNFDSTRSGWLVLEEARLVVQVAAGDVFLFPSAIFTHWNTPLVGGDQRNSLAFWTGATLYLWAESGGKAFNRLPEDQRKAKLARTRENWTEAWKRFPIL